MKKSTYWGYETYGVTARPTKRNKTNGSIQIEKKKTHSVSQKKNNKRTNSFNDNKTVFYVDGCRKKKKIKYEWCFGKAGEVWWTI